MSLIQFSFTIIINERRIITFEDKENRDLILRGCDSQVPILLKSTLGLTESHTSMFYEPILKC